MAGRPLLANGGACSRAFRGRGQLSGPGVGLPKYAKCAKCAHCAARARRECKKCRSAAVTGAGRSTANPTRPAVCGSCRLARIVIRTRSCSLRSP
eukprot:1969344-Prymnesium_polylepis.1